MTPVNPGSRPRRARQRGVATLLILLLTGLAVVVTALAVAYALRSNQQRQLATHSVTTAQASAWRGVEFLRDVLNGMADTDEGQQVLYSLSWGASPDEGCIPASGGACSGAMDELPAWDSASEWTAGTELLAGDVDLGVDTSMGFGASITRVTRMADYHSYQVTARVTGQAAGSVIEPLATSSVEVVYEIRPSSGTEEHWNCPAPKGAMVFNGDLIYSGGKLDVENPERDYENVVVAGNLTIGSGSTAKISGCIKGNVNISGGGITDNGHIYSEGDIVMNGMHVPNGTTIWGKSFRFDGGSGSPLAQVKVGAFDSTVSVGGTVVGTARVGGKLIASTVSGGIPWTVGTVLPAASGTLLITLDAGRGTGDEVQFLLDLGADGITIDPSSGLVTGVPDALEQIAGPDSDVFEADGLVFRSVSIFGGRYQQTSGASMNVGTVWGHNVFLENDSRRYGEVLANGNLEIQYQGVVIDSLTGGGSIWSKSGNYYNVNDPWWSVSGFATVTGKVAGEGYYGGGKQVIPSSKRASNFKVDLNQAGTTPGLPGIPWCDARVNAVNAEDFKGLSNYVFEVLDGVPTLTIRNVNRADGTSIAGTYVLGSLAAGQAGILNDLVQCSGGTGASCFTTNHKGEWVLSQLTWMAPGVMWFDRKVNLSTTRADALVATLVGESDFNLSDTGGNVLRAPNFSTVERVCRGPFYPTTLCEKKGGALEFVTWEDAEGNSYRGLPVASSSVITEGKLSASGWTLYGNVLLGGALSGGNGGALVTIHGTLTVGANGTANSTVSAGGMAVVVPAKSEGHNISPVCEKVSGVVGRPVTVRWSRYL